MLCFFAHVATACFVCVVDIINAMAHNVNDSTRKGENMTPTIMRLSEVRKALQDRRLSKVAEETGIGQTTLREVRDGLCKDHSYNTIEKISDYLEGRK